jgi:hypothetical protein
MKWNRPDVLIRRTEEEEEEEKVLQLTEVMLDVASLRTNPSPNTIKLL